MMKLVRCSPDFVYLKSCMCLALVLSYAQSLVGGSPQTGQEQHAGPLLTQGLNLGFTHEGPFATSASDSQTKPEPNTIQNAVEKSADAQCAPSIASILLRPWWS